MPTAYANPYLSVASAEPTERAAFIRKTYFHLAGAIFVWVALEAYLIQADWAIALAGKIMGFGPLVTLGAFILVSWIADRWARSDTSRGIQYAGLGLYVLLISIFFLPLLLFAVHYSSPDVIPNAATTTGFLFTALTATAFATRADFSFLRGVLMIGSIVAIGIIAAGAILGFSLGTWFAGGMVLLMAVSILYTTSQMIHEYRTDQYVAASLGLFSSVAMMFFYILRLFMSRD